nr:putative reverse transcriptase domain-containing protein [Tanacetum cinerariifolium]
MPPRRTMNINDVYERIMERMKERLDQFIDQFVNRMNDMMNSRRREDRNDRRNEGEELENSFFEGDNSSLFAELEEWEADDVADDDYKEPLVFNDDQYEEGIVSGDVGITLMPNKPKELVNKPTGMEVAKDSEIPKTMILLLEEFSDVFPDEFPGGLPPLRELQHHIDLDRAINKITVRYRFPIPRIDDLLDQISGATIFTKLDLKSGEHVNKMNCSLNQRDQPAPLMLGLGGKFFETELNGIVTFQKCFLKRKKVYESKVAVAQEWPTLATITKFRSFHGFASFYRRFILNFNASKVAIRWVLSQGGRPVPYFSKKLTEPKSRILLKGCTKFIKLLVTTCFEPTPIKKVGPLEIVEKMNSNAYRLKLPSHIRCSDVFNVKHMLPYYDDSFDDDLVMNSRANFIYPGGNDAGPSVEERALLFLEARDPVKKRPW